MIQFNLLPDVKMDYIKAKRTKRLVTVTALIAAGASLALLVILFLGVNVAQKKNLNDLSNDIGDSITALHEVKDLDKILTIQNQLNSLPDLHGTKPVASRLFGYLGQVTPAQVTISALNVDFTGSNISITGDSDSISTINKFADTLKFATYKTLDGKDGKPFSNIVTKLSRDDNVASYSFTLTFDPLIFDSNEKVSLVVPKIISTRSETEKPSALFDNAQTPSQTGGTQ